MATTLSCCFTLALFMVILMATPSLSLANMNVIDKCWRGNPLWRSQRQQLAKCSVGFAGKMINNIGKDVVKYKVIDPFDDPLNPKSGTLLDVHITGAGCLLVYQATNIIIHGLLIHHCKAQPPSTVMDGLLDVTRGSTNITVSNNWFRNQDKVMLLGHDDGHLRDKNMKVTVIFNHFGPKCNQRMPRVRHGYAHVANNFYQGWEQYAIGGSMSPSIKSEANFFVAPNDVGNKEVTWRKGEKGLWKFYSVGDVFKNGASFRKQTGVGGAKPSYNQEQNFKVVDAGSVKQLTSESGVLRCSRSLIC
ncbi:hypothetical protein ES332_A06G192800v1 [Gossypium tomentosum]|uniref:Pectate lyase domain-containing protein n=1 Tax=Gossypium tomentosum TaxID=34277 RepID=A0A5D2Q6A7_GOSTO|nr:hypothetical protein ES332_A06G192800v1 [Gossypium tomentosum]